MRDVVIALIPAVVVSVVFYGLAELLVLAVSVISCVALEYLITKYLLKAPSTVGDWSAAVTGILLDAGNPGMDFSLTPFCQKIYRTSELAGDEIVRGLVSQRM